VSEPSTMGAPRAAVPADSAFAIPVRIYWEDTDAGGVVYHARYLHFLERARTEWLRALGHGQQELRQRDGVLFVVHRMEIAFNAPARLDDVLLVSVRVAQLRSASFTLQQTLRRAGDTADLLAASVRIACVDAARFRPRPLPAYLSEGIIDP